MTDSRVTQVAPLAAGSVDSDRRISQAGVLAAGSAGSDRQISQVVVLVLGHGVLLGMATEADEAQSITPGGPLQPEPAIASFGNPFRLRPYDKRKAHARQRSH